MISALNGVTLIITQVVSLSGGLHLEAQGANFTP